MTIPVTTRSGKGSPLTTAEMDTNLTDLARDSTESQQGNIRIATAAEAEAGVLDDVAITPNNLGAVIDSFFAPSTIASDGFITLNNELLVQWGSAVTAFTLTEPAEWTATETITFNTSFAGTPFGVFATPTAISGPAPPHNAEFDQFSNVTIGLLKGGTLDATQAEIIIASNSPNSNPVQVTYYWLAIGEAP